MLSARWMMFIGFAFIVGTLMSLLMEGLYLGAGQVGILSTLTGYNVVELNAAGVLPLGKLGPGFFVNGLPTIFLWDYRFLDGAFEIIKYILLWPLSFGAIYGIVIAFVSAVQGIFGQFTMLSIFTKL